MDVLYRGLWSSVEMDQEQIGLVRESWKKILPRAPQMASIFHRKLVQLEPAMRGVCGRELVGRGSELMDAIHSVIERLHEPHGIMVAMQPLVDRHDTCPLTDRDLGTVGVALLSTLQQMLEAEFTPAVEQAWAAAYWSLISAVQKARPSNVA